LGVEGAEVELGGVIGDFEVEFDFGGVARGLARGGFGVGADAEAVTGGADVLPAPASWPW
jgi:hypothetical protein